MAKRPIFLWSDWGSLGFLGLRLKRAGHPVTLYVHHEEARMQMTGLLPKTTAMMPPRDALVIFDGVGHGELGALLRKRGQLVIGGNPLDKRLETNRWEGIQVMQKYGIPTPPTKHFSDTGSALRFLEQEGGEWYVKVSSAKASESSTCNADADTLIRYIHYLVTQHPGERDFILQESVDGIETSTDGWFDGLKFVPPFDGTFEDKKFLEGGLGPRTGCEACTVWMFSPQSPLPRETVQRIEPLLAASGYVGPVDLNGMVGRDRVTGLEWTARLGFDASQAWCRFVDPATLGEQLWEFAARGLRTWQVKPGVAYTLRVTLPPYPEGTPPELKKTQGWPLDKKWASGEPFEAEDVMVGEDGPVAAGASGLTGVISQFGSTLKPLMASAKKLAEDLITPQQQYRVNPLTRAEDDWAALKQMGRM